MTGRTSSISIYSEIAGENLEKLTLVEAQIRALEVKISRASAPDETRALEFEWMPLEKIMAKHVSTVIIFAAIAVEVYIYDYAARHLSDKFVQSYLDKLDLVSKWISVPRLISGTSLSKNGNWMALLKGLVKERSSIVHSKSQEFPFDPEKQTTFYRKFREQNAMVPQKTHRAIELLDQLVMEISKLDPEEAPWIQIHFG